MTNKEETKKEKQKKLALQKRYGQRITIARQGREAFTQKDYITASKKYNEYLGILAESKDLDDVYKLTPAMFEQKSQITELLLISHIYWEISRICEMTPKLQNTYYKALNQFIKFTVNQPYQVFNSEMLRKYIKKNKNVSQKLGHLNQALSQIHVQSKKCFIASECFGYHHPITEQLRIFKKELLNWPLGEKTVEFYYRISSRIVNLKTNKYPPAILFIFIMKTPLRLFAKFTQTSIFKRCSYFLKSLRKSGLNH